MIAVGLNSIDELEELEAREQKEREEETRRESCQDMSSSKV
jgi:hypothetical protein